MTRSQQRHRRAWCQRRLLRLAAGMLAVTMLLAGCSEGVPKAESDRTATPELSASPDGPSVQILPLANEQWERMRQAGMVRPECPVRSRSQLRVLTVEHYGFDGEVHTGVLVANVDVVESLARIFTALYQEKFPIQQMVPVEQFAGDTEASLRANNTSAYNCRRPDQINAPFMASPHANGRAIDINPVQNPWMDLRCDCWVPSSKYRERIDRPGGIVKAGLVWRLFRREGWIWQNIDVPDYMHFDTGYPSRRFPELRGNN